MSTEPSVSCEQFDAHADALALGDVDEPLRSALLAHAASCPTCRHLLAGLDAVVDGLLGAAPDAEPPAGFEARVLARLEPAAQLPPQTGRARIRSAAVVAAAVLAAGAIGAGLARRGSSPAEVAAGRTAGVVAVGGDRIGTVQLVDEPVAHLLVTIDSPQPAPGVRRCQLLLDGGWVEVGTWTREDLRAGVWATGVEPPLLRASGMRVLSEDGTVLATATFA